MSIMIGKGSLFKEIESFASQDPKQHEQLNFIISSYKTGRVRATEAFKQISQLVAGNDKLLSSLYTGPDIQHDVFAQFVEIMQTNIDTTASLNQANRVTFLYLNDLVTAIFLEFSIHNIAKELKTNQKRVLLAGLERLMHSKLSMRDVREEMLNSGITDDLLIPINVRPSLTTQILFMISTLPSGHKVTVIKALDLYSMGIMSMDTLYTLISPINVIIAQTIEEAGSQYPEDALSPALMFTQMQTELDDHTCMTILTVPFFEFLKDQKKMTTEEFMKERKKNQDMNLTSVISRVGELKSKKMMKSLKQMTQSIRDLRDGKCHIQSFITGGHFAQKNSTFYSALSSKMRDTGAAAFNIEDNILSHAMEALAPSTCEWRSRYKEKLKKNRVVRQLVFLGHKCSFTEAELNKTLTVCETFVAHFSGLDSQFKAFKSFWHTGEYDLIEAGALSVFYFSEVMDMLREVDDVREIGNIVFTEESPLRCYDGLAVSNVDLALKNFAVYLNMCLHEIDQFKIGSVVLSEELFLYHTKVSEGAVEVTAYQNVLRTEESE